MERVAAGTHFPTPWLFEPAKRSEDKTDYCLGSSTFLPLLQASGTRFYTWVDWGAPYVRTVVMAPWVWKVASNVNELGHVAMQINFLAWRKNQLTQASFEHVINIYNNLLLTCMSASLADTVVMGDAKPAFSSMLTPNL